MSGVGLSRRWGWGVGWKDRWALEGVLRRTRLVGILFGILGVDLCINYVSNDHS